MEILGIPCVFTSRTVPLSGLGPARRRTGRRTGRRMSQRLVLAREMLQRLIPLGALILLLNQQRVVLLRALPSGPSPVFAFIELASQFLVKHIAECCGGGRVWQARNGIVPARAMPATPGGLESRNVVSIRVALPLRLGHYILAVSHRVYAASIALRSTTAAAAKAPG
jgi:hypothetical protein